MFVVQDKMSKLTASKTRVPHKPRKDDSRLIAEFSPYAVPVQSSKDIICSQLSPVYNKAIRIPYLLQCFEEVTELGEGSYGVVYKALCKDDRKWYAVKKYKRPFKDHVHRQRLLEVVHRHMQISCNEHIVKCVQAWEEAGYLFVQMELCSGTLYQYMASWTEIKERNLWSMMLDLILGIQHLHSQEFIHLDIKPENILVTDEGIFKLGDFGLIQQISNNCVNDAEDGDARYLAPEVLQEVFTKPADIFSLGMTLLEVATDIVLPGHGPLWHELRNDCIPDGLFLNTSTEFRDVVCQMLSRDPLARPTVEQLLQHRRLRMLQISRSCLYVPNQMVRTIKHCYWFTKNAVSNCGLIIFQKLGFWKSQPVEYTESTGTPVKNRYHVSSTPCSTASEGCHSTSGTESGGDDDAEGHCSLSPISSLNFQSVSPSISRRWMKLSSCKKRLLLDKDSSSGSVSPQKSSLLQSDVPWKPGRRLVFDSDLEEDHDSVFTQTFEKSPDSSSHDESRLSKQSYFEDEYSEETSGYSSPNDDRDILKQIFCEASDASEETCDKSSQKCARDVLKQISCEGSDASEETCDKSSQKCASADPSPPCDDVAAEKQNIDFKMRRI